MRKFFKNLYYYFLTIERLYKKCETLDVLIIYLDNFKIKSVNIMPKQARCVIVLSDNTQIDFWYNTDETSRYDSTMSDGTIRFSNGKTFTWTSSQPSYEVLYKIKKILKLEKTEKPEKIKSSYEEYLPLKLLRKEKLKKLK